MGNDNLIEPSDSSLERTGLVSEKLSNDGISNDALGSDHIGVEIIGLKPNNLYKAVSILKKYGYKYLQCQGGYDEGPGKSLVSFFN